MEQDNSVDSLINANSQLNIAAAFYSDGFRSEKWKNNKIEIVCRLYKFNFLIEYLIKVKNVCFLHIYLLYVILINLI